MNRRTMLALLGCGIAGCIRTSGGGDTTPTATPTPVTMTDSLVATAGQADILFVINNTDASMRYKASILSTSAQGFVTDLVQQQVDFHLGVTSMDMKTAWTTGEVGSEGHLNGTTPVVDKDTANPVSTFQTNLVVGSDGDGTELGIDAALTAVTTPLVTGANAGFLRPSARLFVLWLSDEEDNATVPGNANGNNITAVFTPSDYVTAFADAKGGEANLVVLSAIAGPGVASLTGSPAGCGGGSGSSSNPASTGADAQVEYNALVTATGGLYESACDTTYTTILGELEAKAAIVQPTYLLTHTPVPASITVKVNGSQVASSDWTYSAATNAITFGSSALPPPAATIDITYTVAS